MPSDKDNADLLKAAASEKKDAEEGKLSNKLIKGDLSPEKEKVDLLPEKEDTESDEVGGIVYATGKRKESVARVWVTRGTGKFSVNKREKGNYFCSITQIFWVDQPFIVIQGQSKYDVKCTVKGGGISGQAGAVRLGIARALCILNPSLKLTLKKEGLLKRDSRVVERKKYGRHKARKKPQFSKR